MPAVYVQGLLYTRAGCSGPSDAPASPALAAIAAAAAAGAAAAITSRLRQHLLHAEFMQLAVQALPLAC